MGNYDKKYWSMKLFPKLSEDRKAGQSSQPEQEASAKPQEKRKNEISLQDGLFYEIEYDSSPAQSGGMIVPKSQKIEAPEKDEVRELFDRMREIARKNRFVYYGNSKYHNRKMHERDSEIFYKQAQFMKDFEDEYPEVMPYTEYFPYYQMMGYKQLRTYFTWRTKVRKGHVEDTSLSYAYLYIYELLNNIGVDNPQDGLDKLVFFWKEFRIFQPSVDKYVLRWLKDYHVYYELSKPFAEFIKENNLTEYYPNLTDSEDVFALFCALSKYDIRKSNFYTEDREKLIQDCFSFTIGKMIMIFAEHGIDFEEIIFPSMKTMSAWTPFQEALFYPCHKQRDRRVVLSSKEIYICNYNEWKFRTTLTTESGKQLLGYILKQMEAVLRQMTGYKYKITAGIGMVNSATVRKLMDAGISLEENITSAVTEFYREVTKTVVTVDKEALAKIRQEALLTQERLLVPEEEDAGLRPPVHVKPEETVSLSPPPEPEEQNPWNELKQALTQTERDALVLVLHGDTNIKQFADAHGVMLEVLLDGINEKAVDFIGDSLLDDEFAIYEDYIEQVKEMME